MANYAVPAPDDAPSAGYAVPAPDDAAPKNAATGWQAQVKPAQTFNGHQSVQRSDGAVWYGPAQGNTGEPGWFDTKGNRAGDAPGQPYSAGIAKTAKNTALATMAAIGSIPQAAIGAYGKVGQSLAENTPLDIPGWQAANQFNQNQAQYRQGLTQGTHGFAEAGNALGETASQIGLGSLLPTSALATQAGNYAQQATSPLGRIAQTTAAGMAGAFPYGIQGALTTPPAQGESYPEHMAGTLQGTMATGAAIPGGLSALGEAAKIPGAISSGLKAPAPGDLLNELGSRLGGKSPGVSLQDSANAKYNEAWDHFSKAVAPVDSAAPSVEMDYSPAVSKLQEVLGVGQKRAPMAMPDARRKVLTDLLGDLTEASDPNGGVSNDFAGAMDIVKKLGAAQRTLAQVHGDTEARGMLGDVRDSILDSMNKSNPDLADSAKAARQVFATQVAPLFDKSEGGQFLTQIRDTPTPNDLIGSLNQGALTRMKTDKMGIIAKGSSADPLLYSMLDSAINQSQGKPGSFVTSIHKAMPAIDQIADPETAAAFHGLERVASTAKWTGMLANIGAGAAVGSANPGAGAATALAASFNPKFTGPGMMWQLLQNPATQKALQYASQVPAGPELENLAGQISRISGAAYPFMHGASHPTTQEEYDAIPSGQPYQSISGAPGVKP